LNKESYVINTFSGQSKFIGDDAAVVGKHLYSQDAFFENVHFKRSWMNSYQIGYKAMMINLSDAIAMNAQPKQALLTLAIPSDESKEEIQELMRGLLEAANLYNCEIIGGDTIANSKLDISITIISQSSSVLYRKNLKEGDLLAFTGKLGSSAKDLKKLFRGGQCSPSSRFIRPVLRQDFISKAFSKLHAGMDISDGLYEDSKKLTAMINRSFKPLIKLDKSVYCSGEEYEMLVSFSPKHLKALKQIAKATKTPLTVFAKVCRTSKKAYCKSNHF
jgi:thiamine-monophosphate kinase